jgi:hypothetical protein
VVEHNALLASRVVPLSRSARVFSRKVHGEDMSHRSGRTILGVVFCCLHFISPVQANDVFDHPQSAEQLLKGPLAQPAAALRGAQVMRGKFVYKKYLREIPQPLISRGDFVFVRELGINWHTREPFDS